MSATEASRSFAAVLDSVEHGETIVVTRGGRRIAVIEPAPASNGSALNDVLSRFRADEDFARDVKAARELLKDDVATWPDA
jgi:prevent-host-death family protein